MGRARRVDGQATYVTDVRNMTVQVERLDELLASLDASLDLEGHDGACPATAAVLLRPIKPGARRQPGKAD